MCQNTLVSKMLCAIWNTDTGTGAYGMTLMHYILSSYSVFIIDCFTENTTSQFSPRALYFKSNTTIQLESLEADRNRLLKFWSYFCYSERSDFLNVQTDLSLTFPWLWGDKQVFWMMDLCVHMWLTGMRSAPMKLMAAGSDSLFTTTTGCTGTHALSLDNNSSVS